MCDAQPPVLSQPFAASAAAAQHHQALTGPAAAAGAFAGAAAAGGIGIGIGIPGVGAGTAAAAAIPAQAVAATPGSYSLPSFMDDFHAHSQHFQQQHQHQHQHQQHQQHHHFHPYPNLFHSLSHHGSSVLAIAVDENAHVAYSASQSECIVVWDLLTLQERTRLKGHTASVLALELAMDKGWLFSSSGDNTVRIWDIHSHQPVAVLYPAEDNVGDIFSLQWSRQLQTLYVGCQNTSIQWISLESVPASSALPVPAKPHKFFDSVPVALRRQRQREEAHSMYAASSNTDSPGSHDAGSTTLTSAPRANSLALSSSQDSHLSVNGLSSPETGFGGAHDGSDLLEEEENVVHLQFSGDCIVPFAHFGYVFSLLLFYPEDAGAWPRHPYAFSDDSDTLSQDGQQVLPILASASGDEHIKLWNCQPDGSLTLRATLHNADADAGGILALAHRPNTLLAGTQAGTIDVWDLETLTTVRTLRAHADDVLSLTSLPLGDDGTAGNDGDFVCFSSGADGLVRRWDAQFVCTAAWKAHEGLALACVPLRLGSGSTRVITGGSDDLVKLWDFPLYASPSGSAFGAVSGSPAFYAGGQVGGSGLGGPGGSGSLTPSGSYPPSHLRRTTSSASIPGSSSPYFSIASLRSSLLSSAASASASSPTANTRTTPTLPASGPQQQSQEADALLSALARFVAYRTVSSDETYREESRQCAHWLKTCLTQLGAETVLLPGANRRNPLVLATFRGRVRGEDGVGAGATAGSVPRRKKRCLFYGHYDVVDDDSGAAHFHQHHQHSHPSQQRGSGHHHHGRPGTGSGVPPRGQHSSGGSMAPPGFGVGGSSANRPRGGSGSGLGATGTASPLHQSFLSSTSASSSSSSATSGGGVSGLPPPSSTSPPYSALTASAPGLASEPWTLTGRDGYLYGRGASDNKGPILAVACAAAELLARRELEMDVVMLIEGEEEVGSGGLEEAVRKARSQIGSIDVILLSNSYWLGEETPCITMGLRGVIHATIEVLGADKDVHSGVEGGALREPMIDMARLLATLSDGDEVLIPSFYDAVRPVSDVERSKLAAIAKMERRGQRSRGVLPAPVPVTVPSHPSSPSASTTSTTESLIARWCRPSLSIHRVGVSGSGNATVIPSKVEAAVSLRIVPDMDADEVGQALEAHVQVQFGKLRSSNRVSVRIDHRADWWLGSETSPFSQALADAIEAEWGEAPVSIREGGSIPAIALLEKELDAPAVHLPMGQSSDNAHLPGERIRLVNLQRGRAVVRRFFETLPGLP